METSSLRRSRSAQLCGLAALTLGTSCGSAPRPRVHPAPPAQFCAGQLARPNPTLLAVSAGGAVTRADTNFASGQLAVARYDGCNLEIFPQSACFGQGRYSFRRGTPLVTAEHRVLRNRAEMTAEAPLLAAEIGGGLRLSGGSR
jgi:hypothetical protein